MADGNTIGKITSEVPASNVKASDANPPVEPETKKEGGFWTSVLDGVQFILDVGGLVPGVGEIADGANAIIYTARGDYLNAALSTAAMIPFAGWAATGTKVIGKGITKKVAKEVVEEAVEKVAKEAVEEVAEKVTKEAAEKAAKEAAEKGAKIKNAKHDMLCKTYATKAYTDGAILTARLADLAVDKLNLFKLAKSTPSPSLPKGSGSWDGHIHQAEGRQRGLKNAITAYDIENCKSPVIPKTLRTLAYTKMPTGPGKK